MIAMVPHQSYVTQHPFLFTPGVPELSLAMYPFSISIDEHVPLDMSAGRIFSRDGPIVDFPWAIQKYFAGDQKWQNYIFTTLRKQHFLQNI